MTTTGNVQGYAPYNPPYTGNPLRRKPTQMERDVCNGILRAAMIIALVLVGIGLFGWCVKSCHDAAGANQRAADEGRYWDIK